MYKIGAFAPICPMMVGQDTWNPLTGKCGPAPDSAIVPHTGRDWEPIVVMGPFIDPDGVSKMHDYEKNQETYPAPASAYTGTAEKTTKLLLWGAIAFGAVYLLRRGK